MSDFLDHGFKPQYCAQESCPKHTQRLGGTFRVAGDGKTYCEDCFAICGVREPGKNLWDYSTTHFDGKPQYIGSLANMRRLEKKYGVSNQAANDYTRNW